ncbi:MAG TPA: hypothetical protein VM101_10560, partial [Flavitalea sp.]|nr:hypothetical protein [Flavitalea sp.]
VAGFEDSPVPERIVKILQTLGDSSTVEYIKRHYGEMEGEREPMKYTLLEVLSNIKTSASYGVLKDKLLTDLPHEGDPSSLEYTLQDSSELTRTLFPEILQLVRDSVFAQSLVSIALPLVDSGALHVSDLMPYRQAFLSLGKKNLQLMKKDSDKVWEYSDWIPFIGKFNDRESNAMLREYLKLSELEIKHLALITLIKNNQPVPPSDIEKVAAGLFLRNQLYEELTEMKKTQLFPLKYRNQKSLAEGQLFAIAADEVDDADCNLVFIGERIAMYRGKKNKFYLFKVNLIFEDSSESYLGIAGPYEVVPKTLVNYGENTNMVWNEEYSTSKTEKQFRTFLKDHENYYREKDMPAESLNILKK